MISTMISDNFANTPLYWPHIFAASLKAFITQFSSGKLRTSYRVLSKVSKIACLEVKMACFKPITRSRTSLCIIQI